MLKQYRLFNKAHGMYSLGIIFIVTSEFMTIASYPAFAQEINPVVIPLLHVSTDNDDDFDALGIMIGIEDSTPRLFQFDTGSDDFLGQFDAGDASTMTSSSGKPTMVAYGDGTYGYWWQKLQFNKIHYHDPKTPTAKSVVTINGNFAVGQILDWVYTRNHYGFTNHKTTTKPIGSHDGAQLYADLDVRERIKKGEPSDHPPFYGTYGAGNFKMSKGPSANLGAQTKSGYVISANANIGSEETPGCAPCLALHLDQSIRSQFTAIVPWGKLNYEDYQRRFDQSGANASNEHEGAYNYTISVKVGKKKRAVDFKGPILFDTGTPEFIYIEQDYVLKKLRSAGFKLGENETDNVDIKLHGFSDILTDVETDDVEITRISDEDEGNGITLGLPFFQMNSLMYDLENRATAYSPYFVTAQDFTTDATKGGLTHLNRITATMGSSGWLGLAGHISGSDNFTLEKDTNIRISGINDYTGATHINSDSHLHLAGPGSLEHSSHIVINGALYIDQKGAHLSAWNVTRATNDASFRSIEGNQSGFISLGNNKMVLTAANGRFDGTISDYDGGGKNLGGSLTVGGGKLILGGENDYSGITDVALGAELQVVGSLTGDVVVSGTLVVEGQVYGTVTVRDGGKLSGNGQVGNVKVLSGGKAEKMKAVSVN